MKGVKEGEDREEDDQGSGKEEDGRESPVSGRTWIDENLIILQHIAFDLNFSFYFHLNF